MFKKVLFLFLIGLHACVMPSKQEQEIYQCKLHPEVQSSSIGVCNICGLSLKKIEPQMDPPRLELAFEIHEKDTTGLYLQLFAGEKPISLQKIHEHAAHVVLTSTDFSYFEYLHPEKDANDRYVVHFSKKIENLNNHHVFLYFSRSAEKTEWVHAVLGEKQSKSKKTNWQFNNNLSIGDVQVNMMPQYQADSSANPFSLHFSFTHLADTLHAQHLDDYLGSKAILIAVSEDMQDFWIQEPLPAAHQIAFETPFLKNANYKLWLQFLHDDVFYTADFQVQATYTAPKFFCPMYCEGKKRYAVFRTCPVCKMDLVEKP